MELLLLLLLLLTSFVKSFLKCDKSLSISCEAVASSKGTTCSSLEVAVYPATMKYTSAFLVNRWERTSEVRGAMLLWLL